MPPVFSKFNNGADTSARCLTRSSNSKGGQENPPNIVFEQYIHPTKKTVDVETIVFPRLKLFVPVNGSKAVGNQRRFSLVWPAGSIFERPLSAMVNLLHYALRCRSFSPITQERQSNTFSSGSHHVDSAANKKWRK